MNADQRFYSTTADGRRYMTPEQFLAWLDDKTKEQS